MAWRSRPPVSNVPHLFLTRIMNNATPWEGTLQEQVILMSLDALLHIIGFGFVIALWLTAILGICEICRKLRVPLNEGRPRPAAAIKGRLVTC